MPKAPKQPASLYEGPQGPSREEFAAMSADAAIRSAEKSMFDHPILTREQEVLLAKRIERGDMRAKDMLIRCNMKLAAKIAYGRARSCEHLTSDDLLVAAVQGLNRAAEKFDYRKGYKFSTYATNWIKQQIGREIANLESTIRIPVHVVQVANEIRELERVHLLDHAEPITDAEIALALEIPEHEVNNLRTLRYVGSLDRTVGEDGETTFGSFIPSDEAPIEEQVADSIENAKLAEAFKSLTDDQRAVVIERFINEKGLQEVSKQLGKSRVDVRLLEREGMKRLNASMASAADAPESAQEAA